MQRRAEVAAGEQLLIQPAGFEGADVVVEGVATFATGEQSFGHGVGGEHAGLHGGVAAFDLEKFRVPRSQPISAPPLKTIFGSEFRPPLQMARAP